ncbi:MAG: sulfatase-like hydrolase/transferase [Lentisphaeria bacterium]|nr:sulfatase-like hydrolase/transferase [Lentisphaeria bacterium]
MLKKNILLITTDQQSATMMSCTGNQDLNTPHLDQLARDGVRFEKAYAAQPLCIPQRNCWYTGMMPSELGITYNHLGIPNESTTWMGKIFQEAGYATGISGKWHVNLPVEESGFEWISNIRENGADEHIVPDFQRFLADKEDRPFLFSASFNNPHNICEAARGGYLADGNPGTFENINQLPELPKNFEIPTGEPDALREVQKIYSRVYPTQNWDETRWRIHRWMYARMNEMIDQKVGELITILRENGLYEDTLIVYSSDHGDGDGHHKWNQKQSLYDESARIPFIISQPGSNLNQVNTTQLVNNGIDLIPTLCGLANIEAPKCLQGKDWSQVLTNTTLAPQREYLIAETEFCGWEVTSDIKARMVRSQQFKYIIFNQGEPRESLIDMDADPGEMNNLINSVDHAVIIQQHRDYLKDYLQKSADNFGLELIP